MMPCMAPKEPARPPGGRASPWRIRVAPARGDAHEQPLVEGDLTIGRARDNALPLPDPSLSRHHAVLRLRAGQATFEDLGSRNGSLVNGELATGAVRLHPGDVITLGGNTIELLSSAAVSLTGAPSQVSDATAVFDVTRLSDDVGAGRFFKTVEEENRALTLLTRAGSVLIAHRPLPDTLEAMLDLCVDGFAAERAAVAILEPGRTEPDIAAARGPGGATRLDISRTIASTVALERKAIAITDVEADPRLSESVRLQGVNSVLCAPLWDGARVQGLLYVDRRLARRAFSEADLTILSMLANVLAVKLENARLAEEALEAQRLEEELRVAARIQQRLLPEGPCPAPGLDVHGICRACSAIGGDFYDYFALPGGMVGLIIADVCGKGVGGALLAASLQAAVRGGSRVSAAPSERMSWLNTFVHDHAPVDRYITCAYVEVDPASGRLEHVSAGHPPALLVRASGAVEVLGAGGPPLGIVERPAYDGGQARLLPGDRLVLHTDGILEASPPGTREPVFGLDRLARVVAAEGGGARDAADAVFGALDDLVGSGSLRDDATVLVAALAPRQSES
jgi:serine phosphatase RsbU (regulator of sigma subunit)